MTKKIIVLNGRKNTGKDYIAKKLAKNTDVDYILPYTDRKSFKNVYPEFTGGYHYIESKVLSEKMEKDTVLVETVINRVKFVFFESQLTSAYNVLILDDESLKQLKKNWKGDLTTVRVVSDKSKESERFDVSLNDSYFHIIYNKDYDDFDELEAMIV